MANRQTFGFNPPGGFGAFGTQGKSVMVNAILCVSIRRADLGLLEQIPHHPAPPIDAVSIRRADLGLLEPMA